MAISAKAHVDEMLVELEETNASIETSMDEASAYTAELKGEIAEAVGALQFGDSLNASINHSLALGRELISSIERLKACKDDSSAIAVLNDIRLNVNKKYDAQIDTRSQEDNVALF